MSQQAEFESPEEAIAAVQRQPQPRTAEEVWEQLNILEKAVSLIDPVTDYQAEILEALLELIRLQKEGALPGEPGDNIAALLEEIAILNDQQVRGITDTTDLPAGLSGTATEPIDNDATGTAVFDVSGGRFAAEVEAAEPIEAEDQVRILPQGQNLVAPIPRAQQVGGTALVGTSAIDDDVRIAADQATPAADAGDEEGVARLTLGPLRTALDLFYDVDVSTDFIRVEARSDDDAEWDFLFERAAADIPADGTERVQLSAPETFVRAFASSAFADDDVNKVRIVAKGAS